MVGGGDGAFIGAVHRAAARLDDALELVCGAFSSDPERNKRAGPALGLDPERCYTDFATMFAREAELPSDARMEFVAIVTPNHLHYPVARAALERGFHVLSDKPATISVAECRELGRLVESSGRLYGLTHAYTAYPMIVEARRRVAAGELGRVRKVLVAYVQGWLAEPVERQGNAQAEWRTDPARAGPSGCFGDIGVHAFNLAEYVCGQAVTSLCADLNRIVPERTLDDDGAAWLRFDGGARGVLIASQICTGEENALELRVYGDQAGLEWRQEEPNSLWIKPAHGPAQRLRAGMDYLDQATSEQTRLPAGHPEGYIEAFANQYRSFARQVAAHGAATAAAASEPVPGIEAALRGMQFIEAAVAASSSDRKWHAFTGGAR